MPSPFISKREFARAWQIMRVIGRFGLVPLVQATGIGRLLGVRLWRRMERRFAAIPPPVRLRLALVELGTTFIKLGQVLSARSDLLPPEYLTELSRLQDEVPPQPFSQLEPVFLAAFGMRPTEAFAEFNPQAIASASIGQVYEARMHNGAEVMVKIQRPGVERQVGTDLSLMMRVAVLLNRSPLLARFDLPTLVREFASILQDELLYTLEAHNAETLAKEMVEHPDIRFPEVMWDFTTQQVLTTRRIHGVKITELATFGLPGVDSRKVAVNLANSLLEQILLHGMFHGDPHPGNLMVTYDGTLVFLDTGMVGRLDRKTRELLIELSVSIFDQDIDSVLGTLQQLGIVMEDADLVNLRRDLSRLITKYYFLPRRELRLGYLLQRVNSLLFEHRVRMAYEFGLLAKALFLVEGVSQALDPLFDYNVAARPVIEKVRRRYYSLDTFIDDWSHEIRGMRRQFVDLPRRLSTVLDHLEQGTLHIHTVDDLIDVDHDAHSALVNRAILAMLTLTLIIAGTVLLATHPLGWIMYLAAAMLGGGGVLGVLLLAMLLRT